MSEHRHRIAIEVSRGERELWRRQYHIRPYLEDASDDELADRFPTIIQNMTTPTERGQIGALPREPHGKYWYRLYVELEEAYRMRDGTPPRVLDGARLPRPTYPVPPRALEALRSITTPEPGTYLVKYGARKHMTDLYEKGQLLVSPANSYRDPSLNTAIRDDELTVSGVALKSELRIGIPDKNTGEPIFEAAPLSNVVCTATSIKNYFVYCVSSILDMRLFDDFGYDACVIFSDPADFIRRVQYAIEHHCGGWLTDHQLVRYIDPYNWRREEQSDVFFAKHFRYWYQHEYRITWLPPLEYPERGQNECLSVMAMRLFYRDARADNRRFERRLVRRSVQSRGA
jgi:hypothetical protein